MAILGTAHGSLASIGPARSLRAVNISDTGTLTGLDAESPCVWLYVSDTGDLAVLAEGDTGEQVLTVSGVSGGLPARVDVRAKRVRTTGTTVTKIVAAFG